MQDQSHYVYEFGPFHLDASRRILLKEGKPLKLFPKEFDTLLALVEHNGEVLNKDDLMRRVWQDTIVEESNLTTNISHLRKLLGENRGSHDYIVTVPGRGYRFVAGVKLAVDEVIVRNRTTVTIEEEESESAEDSSNAVEEQQTVSRTEATRNKSFWRGRREFVLASAAVMLAVAGFSLYRITKSDRVNERASVAFSELKFTRLTNSGRARLAAMSPDGRYIVHVSKDAEGESLWLKQVVTQSNVQIAPPQAISYWGLTFSPDGEYIYCVTAESNKGDTTLSMIPVLGGAPRRLPVGPHGPVSFSPDGKSFAFVDGRQVVFHLSVADNYGGSPRLIASRTTPEKFIDIAVGPAWSPDGKEIACAVRKQDANGYFETVVAISARDGSERSLTPRRWSAVGQIAWPDSDGLVFTARETPSSPLQIWQISGSAGDIRRVTNDLNDYSGISYNAATRSLLAVQTNLVSGVFVMRSGDLTDAQITRSSGNEFPIEEDSAVQITSETGRLHDIAWTGDGKIVYVSHAANGSSVWVWDPNSSAPRQLTVDTRNTHGLAVSPDDRHLVVSSDRTGTFNLWRVDMSGGELVRLTTSGDGDVLPTFSPDGRWVVYQRGFPTGARIWRVSLDGRESMPLTQTRGQSPDVSPDGKVVAYHTLDSESESPLWVFGTMAFDGGPFINRFLFAPTVKDRFVRWVPGGWGLAYSDTSGSVSNIWVQPIAGGRPWQLSNFKSQRIDLFDWSPDGRSVAAVRSSETSDVVLIQSNR